MLDWFVFVQLTMSIWFLFSCLQSWSHWTSKECLSLSYRKTLFSPFCKREQKFPASLILVMTSLVFFCHGIRHSCWNIPQSDTSSLFLISAKSWKNMNRRADYSFEKGWFVIMKVCCLRWTSETPSVPLTHLPLKCVTRDHYSFHRNFLSFRRTLVTEARISWLVKLCFMEVGVNLMWHCMRHLMTSLYITESTESKSCI
jgi:hypothetical protein